MKRISRIAAELPGTGPAANDSSRWARIKGFSRSAARLRFRTQRPTRTRAELEEIRALMLYALRSPAGAFSPALAQRIQRASDLEGLWYLRVDLLQVLARTEGGEMRAQQKLAVITQRFAGLVGGAPVRANGFE